MLTTRFVAKMLSVAMMVLIAGTTCGQDFPNKPIRITASEPGGSIDFGARIIAQALADSAGWHVLIDNRPTFRAADLVSKAPPDGYTLLFHGNAFWTATLLQKTPYDLTDFIPITLATNSFALLVVHPSVPAKSVKELIALAKARPGELNYASATIGSSFHLAAELFKYMAGVNITRIPYKGSGAIFSDLIAGQVQVTFGTAASIMPYVKSGRLRALAVTSAEPSALVPGLPAIASSLKGYEAVSRLGIFAPAKTPEAIITRLNRELVRALGKANVKEKFLASGMEAVGSSPDVFAAKIASDMDSMAKLIKNAGIQLE